MTQNPKAGELYMKCVRTIISVLCVVFSITTLWSVSSALEGLQLVKAGFTATPEKEAFQKKELSEGDEFPLDALQGKRAFFWTEVQCDQGCQAKLRPDTILVVHRWVRVYARVVTVQTKEFSLQEFLDKGNILQSEQEISTPGAWFVEVRMPDGNKLCISRPKSASESKEQPDICKFDLRIR
jgi:hypothetical protein